MSGKVGDGHAARIDRRAQILTALAQGTGLFMAVAGHWATPYGYEPFEWVVLFWILLRWMRTRDDRLLLALGVMGALGISFNILASTVPIIITVSSLGIFTHLLVRMSEFAEFAWAKRMEHLKELTRENPFVKEVRWAPS